VKEVGNQGTKSLVLVLVLCGILLTPCVDGANIPDNTIRPSVTTITRDVGFVFTSSFGASNLVTRSDYAERSAADLVSSISAFVPDGVNVVETVPVHSANLKITITQIHVIEDRDFGAGEIYFKIRLNDYREYTFDNDGAYYVANDGDYIYISETLEEQVYSMDGWFCIEAHGWESDYDYDDYMGGEITWYDLDGVTRKSISGWWTLDDFSPDGGNNDVQLELYMQIEFSSVEVLTYPDDFAYAAGDGSWLISAVYFPAVYYDVYDAADSVPVKAVYETVFYGYDSTTGANAYLIYYLFYWEYELDNFGLNFGHYYDYEPLLLFVKEIGDEPYRIVYRNVGSNTLPPCVIIQEEDAIPSSGIVDMVTSPQLTPLLGPQSNVTYSVVSTYFDTPAYQYTTDHGLTPYMRVPIITITNTYHQMEVGIPLGSVNAMLSPLSCLLPLSDQVIATAYAKLDEAFDSSVNVYEGVSLWNGGDYRVPQNMSLTIDMLRNPFEFPYIVDCWEDVAHYTEARQDYKKNGLYYDVSLDLSFYVPAVVTLTVPTILSPGESYTIGIDLALSGDDIRIVFDYNVELEYLLRWWFIDIDKTSSYSGHLELGVSVDDIVALVSRVGLSSERLTGEYLGGWIAVTNFETSSDLLSILLDCTVEVHLLKILGDLLGTSSCARIVRLLKVFFDEVSIVAHPTISGYVTASVEAMNDMLSIEQQTLRFDEGSTHTEIPLTVLGHGGSTGIRIYDMRYNLQFQTDWSVDVDFTDTMNSFVEDFQYDIGVFPNITLASDDHKIEADVSTDYDDWIAMTVSSSASSSTSSTSSTQGTSGVGETSSPPTMETSVLSVNSSLFGLGVGVLAGVAVLVVLKRRNP